MGGALATKDIRNFLNRLGNQYAHQVKLYLLGGSALCFLGSTRQTVDIDISVDESSKYFIDTINSIADELNVEVEIISLDEFIPLPKGTSERHRDVEKFGNVEVFVFDPYSIALSKIARGFDTDIQDVLFLLQTNIIEIDGLRNIVEVAIPVAWDYDIDPEDLSTHLDIVKKLYI